MSSYTVCGFIPVGAKYFDMKLEILAESPLDASEMALRQYSNLVVSDVCRSHPIF